MHAKPSHLSAVNLSTEHALWLVANLCIYHNIPFEQQLFVQRYPANQQDCYELATILTALGEYGLQVDTLPNTAPVLSEPTVPCFMLDANHAPHIILPGGERIDAPGLAQRVPVQDTVSGHALHHTAPDTTPQIKWAFQCQPKPQAITDPDALPDEKFGFVWFVPELLKHRKVWRDILIASLLLQIVGLVTPLFTQVIIDKVIVHQTHSTLIAVGVGLFFSMIFSALFTWVRQYLILHTGNRVDAILGAKVFARLLQLPLPYFAHRATGTLVARLHGVETIREFITGAAVSLILDLPFMTILLAVMFYYSWQLALIALALLAILTGLSLAVSPVFRRRLNQQFLLGARNQAFVTEYLSGIETVKSLQLEAQLQRRYGNYLADYLQASFSTKQIGNSYSTTAHMLEQLQSLAVLITGALLVMGNQGFTIGMLVAFQMFASRLSQPMLRLVGLYQEFQQANLAVNRLGDLMDAPVEPYSLIPSRSHEGNGNIEAKGLSFRYSEDRPWLYRDLSLTFKAGKTTLVVGPSGSGKSTLAKLLLGFYRQQEGAIYIDGQDIRHFSANELRGRFGVVPQETVLFSGTLYENLQIANPRASFKQIVQACKMAEMHDVIERLPQAYQTEIGEHGVGLSGGQKQRIAIARALLKHPQILIFDEATSNLDRQTAEQFAKTINRIKGQVTIIFIAHQVPKALLVDETVIIGVLPTNVAELEKKEISQWGKKHENATPH